MATSTIKDTRNLSTGYLSRGTTYISNTNSGIFLLFGKRGVKDILSMAWINGGVAYIADYGTSGYITVDVQDNRLTITPEAYADVRYISYSLTDYLTQVN